MRTSAPTKGTRRGWRTFRVPDAEKAAEQAVSHGGRVVTAPQNSSYGRNVVLADPARRHLRGHRATHQLISIQAPRTRVSAYHVDVDETDSQQTVGPSVEEHALTGVHFQAKDDAVEVVLRTPNFG